MGALYDFEACEDNEISFQAGHVILLLDTSHDSWWTGKNLANDKRGLFPANFVEKVDKKAIFGTKGSEKVQEIIAQPAENQTSTSNSNPQQTSQQIEDPNQQTPTNPQKTSYSKIVIPLDIERAEKTSESLKNHDPDEEENPTMKFNEILCNHMTSEINRH